MFCMGCQYRLENLTTDRCPECGRSFDPNDASTFLASPKRIMLTTPSRAAIALGFFGAWYIATMGHATSNTSWEHHPFAGPFIMIKESLKQSHSRAEWAIGLIIGIAFVSCPLHWVLSGKAWPAIVTLALCGVSILLTCMTAASASC